MMKLRVSTKRGGKMDADLLSAAKTHEKNREYTKAVNCFEQYMKVHKDTSDDTVYVSYGKCLRLIGETNRAKETLRKGNELYPDSEPILKELSSLYEVLGDWKAAKTCAEVLIKINPNQANHHIRLGGIYSQLKTYSEAKEAYKNALIYSHGLTMEILIEKIQRGFTENPADVSTRYVHIGGMNNLGAFIHEFGNKKYFTKITKYKGINKREAFFYKELCADFPILQQLAPMYIDSQIMDQILYLTIEMIDGSPAKPEHFKQARDVSEKIASIKYQDLIGKFKLPNYQFQFNLRNPNIVAHFFTKIHKKKYNRKLFDSLQSLITQNAYPEAVHQMVLRLESLVMDNQLYDLIEPEKHYTLMHGEFKPDSIIIEEDSGTPYVIDWSTFTIGPHFVEMARYLSAFLTSYAEIKQLYLDKDQTVGKRTSIERIFFLYALILFYIYRFIKSRKTETRQQITDLILSALDDMEQLVEFKISLREEKRNVETLEQKISALEKDKKQLNKRLDNVLQSKSWRITAPLRNIVKWKNK